MKMDDQRLWDFGALVPECAKNQASPTVHICLRNSNHLYLGRKEDTRTLNSRDHENQILHKSTLIFKNTISLSRACKEKISDDARQGF
jgi:hypothetical protein